MNIVKAFRKCVLQSKRIRCVNWDPGVYVAYCVWPDRDSPEQFVMFGGSGPARDGIAIYDVSTDYLLLDWEVVGKE